MCLTSLESCSHNVVSGEVLYTCIDTSVVVAIEDAPEQISAEGNTHRKISDSDSPECRIPILRHQQRHRGGALAVLEVHAVDTGEELDGGEDEGSHSEDEEELVQAICGVLPLRLLPPVRCLLVGLGYSLALLHELRGVLVDLVEVVSDILEVVAQAHAEVGAACEVPEQALQAPRSPHHQSKLHLHQRNLLRCLAAQGHAGEVAEARCVGTGHGQELVRAQIENLVGEEVSAALPQAGARCREALPQLLRPTAIARRLLGSGPTGPVLGEGAVGLRHSDDSVEKRRP
mmetsp:Transcript_47633/g.101912  ORF Transcript_47633/g.101912 Transcript_47633/m.101912 type:complete len:288 (+) Transcript_47633:28-891(+)